MAAAEQSADLTVVLSAAAHRAAHFGQPVIFIGSDCPHIPAHEIETATRIAHFGSAYMVPADDGGYALLALPCWLLAAESPLPSPRMRCFEHVIWSQPCTFASQLAALQALGVNVITSATPLRDIDDASDWKWLQESVRGDALRIDGTPFRDACPHTHAMVQLRMDAR